MAQACFDAPPCVGRKLAPQRPLDTSRVLSKGSDLDTQRPEIPCRLGIMLTSISSSEVSWKATKVVTSCSPRPKPARRTCRIAQRDLFIALDIAVALKLNCPAL